MGMEVQVTDIQIRTRGPLRFVGLGLHCGDGVENPQIIIFQRSEGACKATNLGRVHRAGRVGHFVEGRKDITRWSEEQYRAEGAPTRD